MGEIIWSDGKGKRPMVAPPIVSSNLGVMDLVVDDFREDAQKHGFSAVEFVKSEDFSETGHYDVQCNSPAQWEAYKKHRNVVDKNSSNGSGAMISKTSIEQAKEMIRRKYRR
jgi:hypothetical protein